MNIETASGIKINIMIVIDTDYVKAHYPNPSQDSKNPTRIDHRSQFMICTDPRADPSHPIAGQGTAGLNFYANPGDNVSFKGISIYGNSNDAVIVYGIKHLSRDQIFLPFAPNLAERQHAVVPDVTTPLGLPAKTTVGDFISLDSKVAKAGTEKFQVRFGLYTLADDGETQKLLGYYYWVSTITVQ